MTRTIERRLKTLECVSGPEWQMLIAGTTRTDCAARWAAYVADHPGELSAALFVVTGVPRAIEGSIL